MWKAACWDVPARLRLFREVCRAVEYAHRKLVIHRDLKPANILVAADGTKSAIDSSGSVEGIEAMASLVTKHKVHRVQQARMGGEVDRPSVVRVHQAEVPQLGSLIDVRHPWTRQFQNELCQ